MSAAARRALVVLMAAMVAGPALGHHGEEDADPTAAPGSGTSGTSTTPEPERGSALDLSRLLGLDEGGGGSAEPQFLPPDEAYVLEAVATASDAVELRWAIADEYYLYRDKIAVAAADGDTRVASVDTPDGVEKIDEFFGRMEVYYGTALARVGLGDPRPGADVALDVTYQGCADAGLCYPPMTKTVTLSLPGISDARAQAPSPAQAASGPPLAGAERVLPEQDRVAALLAGGHAWLALAAFFGFGLLLAFTPCVLPMVPILSGIIVGQAETISPLRAFSLSLVFVLAMALTYTAAGVAAGLLGANLQAVFQEPWILVTFSAVFVLLALSMFGFYDLQLPSSWQTYLASSASGLPGGRYATVGLMGVLSALIVGPCIAPPLAGALIYIGQSGDAVLGGAALFSLGMGMGTPLLALGTSAGKLLPRAGPWMEKINATLGVLLLGLAIYLLERILPGWATMFLWAALLIVVSIYLGALDTLTPEAGGWRRLRKGAGLVVMLYGALLLVGAAGGGTDVLRPLHGLTIAGAEREEGFSFQRVKGLAELDRAIESARGEGRTVMLDYYADWCISCKQMEKYTFSDRGVQAALAETVWLQTDVTANDEIDREMLEHFTLYGPPAILFFDSRGREIPDSRVMGFMSAEEFRAHLARVLG